MCSSFGERLSLIMRALVQNTTHWDTDFTRIKASLIDVHRECAPSFSCSCSCCPAHSLKLYLLADLLRPWQHSRNLPRSLIHTESMPHDHSNDKRPPQCLTQFLQHVCLREGLVACVQVGDTGLANDQTPAANKRLTMAAAMSSSKSMGSPAGPARTNQSTTAPPENKPPPFFSSKSARFSNDRSIDVGAAHTLAAAASAATAPHSVMRPSTTGASVLEGAPHTALHDGGSVVGAGGASACGGDDAADETRSASGREDARSTGAANSTRQLYETQKMMVELARRQNKIGDQVVKL
ncbi:hypothetical protein DUNSADRAFT_10714, partial [Dunaliella salina]